MEAALDLDAILGLAGPLAGAHGAQAARAAAARPAHRHRRGRRLQLRLSARRAGLARGGRRARALLAAGRRGAGPVGCDACWLPGGYPELHAGRLAAGGAVPRRAAPFRRRPAGARRMRRLHGARPRRSRTRSGVTHPMAGLLGHVTSFARRQDEPRLPRRRGSSPTRRSAGPGSRCAATSSTIRGWSSPAATRRSLELFDGQGQPLGPAGARRGRVTGTFFHAIARARLSRSSSSSSASARATPSR